MAKLVTFSLAGVLIVLNGICSTIGQSVTTADLGTLQGSITQTAWSERTIYQFLGVRYAKPPSGERRFKEPVSAIPWIGTHNVQQHGKPCPNVKDMHSLKQDQFDDDVEDCLHLSIYSKNLSAANPVMIYVHGGAFEFGSASGISPNYLLEKEVVLVVPQYRLGPFGFLSTNTDEIPGNAGVADILLALKWIKNYIFQFGGDPTNITLFGQSAGAALISALLFSPSASLNLFHKVILQSGSAFGTWVYDFDPVKNAYDMAEKAGCNTNTDINDVNRCFMNLEPFDLLLAYRKHSEIARIKGMDQFGGSKLTVNKILPIPPVDILRYKHFVKNIPIITGATKHDGTFILAMIYNYLMKNVDVDQKSFNSYHLLPIVLHFLGIRDNSGSFTGYLIDRFFTQKQISNGNFTEMMSALVDIVSVITMKAPVLSMAQTHAEFYPNQTYLYSFDYEGEYSRLRNFFERDKLPFYKGVHHSDDIEYFFPLNEFSTKLCKEDQKMAETMIELWTSFAKNGVPSSASVLHWPPLTDFSGPFLHINTKCTVGKNFYDEYSVTTSDTRNLKSASSVRVQYGSFLYIIFFIILHLIH